jgi:hypothetical protein
MLRLEADTKIKYDERSSAYTYDSLQCSKDDSNYSKTSI